MSCMRRPRALKPDVDEDIRAITKQSLEENLDRRELCLKIVEYLANNILSINTPTVILFLAPPYCPRNTLKREIPEEGALLDSVVDLLNQLGQEMGEELKMMQFFPVLTDSSYLKLDDTDTSIKTLVDNFPDMEGHYDVPLDQIKRLNIPPSTSAVTARTPISGQSESIRSIPSANYPLLCCASWRNILTKNDTTALSVIF